MVRLEHVDAGGGQPPQEREHDQEGDRRDRREVEPANAGGEHHGCERRGVHEGGADVRLEEHERDRARGHSHRGNRHAELADPLRAVDEEAGEEQREENLPELGGLEAEEAEVDPAARPARRGARNEHEDHHRERASVDHALEPPVDRRIDQRRHDHQHAAHSGVERLAACEAPTRIVPGDPVDRAQAVADDHQDGREQDPVESAHQPEGAHRVEPAVAVGARGRSSRRPGSSSAAH